MRRSVKMGCKIKEAKQANESFLNRYEKGVDNFFNQVGDKINHADPLNMLTTTSVQKEFSHVIREYQVALKEIYDDAGEVHKYLKEDLTDIESQSLVRALNGDMDPIELDTHIKPLYERLRAKIDSNAQDLINAAALQEESKIDNYLKRYYEKHLEEKGALSKIFHSKEFMKRKDLTHDERIALGMVEDASIVVSKTLSEQRTQLLKASVLKSIADKFAKEEPLEGYTIVSDETNGGGIYKYGALAGKYIPTEILNDLQHAELAKENLGIIEKFWFPFIDHVKVNVTVKNPVTHLYNIGSNVMLSFLNGDFKALGETMALKVKDPKAFKELVKKANKYGLDSSLKDFEDMTSYIEEGKGNIALSLLQNLYMTQNSKVGKSIRKLYDWEDKIFKLAGFKRLIEEGLSEKEAFIKASEVYVDYSTPLPAFVRTMDKSGLFPFIHYVYKSTPATMKVIAKHPIRYMLLQTALIGTGASAWLSNNDDDYKPEWAKDQLNLFGAKEWVNLNDSWYLNLGRMLPAMKFGGLDFSLDTGFGFVGGVVNIAQGKTPLGYNIAGVYDPDHIKVSKKLLTMAENYLPPVTFGRYGQRVSKKALGIEQKNYYNEDMGYDELILRATGVRRFNEKKEVEKKLKKAKREKNYKDKQQPLDKTTHENEYNKIARRLKQAGNSIGADLSAKEEFKLPKFDLEI